MTMLIKLFNLLRSISKTLLELIERSSKWPVRDKKGNIIGYFYSNIRNITFYVPEEDEENENHSATINPAQ